MPTGNRRNVGMSKRRELEPSKRRNALLAGIAFWGAMVCHVLASDEQSVELPFVYQTWRTFTTRQGLPHESVRAIHIQGEKVWVGTEGGLALLDGGVWTTWTHLDEAEGAPPVICAIGIDSRTQDVCLGTWGEGLVRYSAGRFDRFDQKNSGLAGNLVFDLVVTRGRVWAATNGGVSSFDPVSGMWDLHL